VTSAKIVDGSITGDDILNVTVTPAKIQPGASNQVLVTDATGTNAQWVNQNTLVPNVTADGTTITGNGSTIPLAVNAISGANISDGTIETVDLDDDAVNGNKLADNAVTSTHVVDGAIASIDIQDNTIATIDIADDAVNGAKLADNSVTTTHIVDETIASADILNGSIATIDIADKAVTVAKIQQGTSNQLLATDATGANAVWVDRTTLPIAGDVTGTLAATTVTAVQGRNVSNAAPSTGQALIWNGTAWAPATVTTSPVTQYYAVDPAAFEILLPDNSNENYFGLHAANNTFVYTRGNARQIIAPVNLPHGAIVQNITVYYQYTFILGPITVNFDRKPLTGGGNQVVGSVLTPLASLGAVEDAVLTGFTAANREIDNSTYSYRVHITFSHLLDVTTPASATQRIYGIRIEYTK
jgi:hypothetical protein